MAEEKKPTFPMLPVAHWWALFEKFKQSIPGVVTDNYLATALNTTAGSARQNILPYLKTIGLINEEGKTQDLAKNGGMTVSTNRFVRKLKIISIRMN